MPLYEYECRACHKRTEKIQKFSDPEITICPHCGGELDRTITAPAFQFAGGGWYKDGYGSAKPAESGGDAKSGDKSGDSKNSDLKSDTTVAAAASADSTSTPATASAPAASATPAPAAPSTPAKS